MQSTWKQWDLQEERRLAREARAAELMAQNVAYVALNNLYLSVERGETPMSVTVSNNLRTLASQAYDRNDCTMVDYWLNEFNKLPRWLDF